MLSWKKFREDVESMKSAEAMIDTIKEELKTILNNIDWLDDKIFLAATQKVDEMYHFISINSLNSWQ